MKLSLSALFNRDPENPGSFKTSMFFENNRAGDFLHDKFQLWAETRGRAQLIAKRNDDGSYDVTAKYHGRSRHFNGYEPTSDPVLLGIDRDTAIATLYAFEETGIMNDAPSDTASAQLHLDRALEKKSGKRGHVVKVRKALGITNDSQLVVADKPIPRPPPPPAPPPKKTPKQTDNPLLARHMKGIKRKKTTRTP